MRRELIFIDTEFNEKPSSIELLSLGLVRDDGQELYAVNGDANHDDVNPWVRENVLPHLGEPTHSHREIAELALGFTHDISPEFWGWYACYDWVVFCWLFGAMIDLPPRYPMFCNDLKQLADTKGVPENDFPVQTGTHHNSLEDARWNRSVYHFLKSQ